MGIWAASCGLPILVGAASVMGTGSQRQQTCDCREVGGPRGPEPVRLIVLGLGVKGEIYIDF